MSLDVIDVSGGSKFEEFITHGECPPVRRRVACNWPKQNYKFGAKVDGEMIPYWTEKL